MNEVTPILVLEQKIAALLSADPTLFLVEIRIKPVNNVKIFIDGDQGVSIDKLAQCNRQVYKFIEESSLFAADDFSLEVSSPGLDEPLKLERQYVKNIGREVEVTEKDGGKISGKLLSANGTEIVVESPKAGNGEDDKRPGKGRKKEWVAHTILFDNIKTTKVQPRF